ncbi:viomycin phosphotransferase [Streptosporangium nondiastaticum]|uniref:Viomycin phosphotransferase n=1 Tax=Streptosporangium nondiastaticum TaxID=35764 RepID=A0A9X7PFX0_9ACTN|nr:aminoglycoside phosphotransferase family protein [Streptosporangium nondiastaticum]PSJ26377.1 viomycin phosphotransferase [Streptosporangium nondiastaticum]
MEITETHRALLGRLLPDDGPGGWTVRRGQFHHVVIGSDRVVCLPRTEAAAARLPARAAVLRALAGLDLGFRTPEPLSEGGGRGSREGHESYEEHDPYEGHASYEVPYLVLTRIPGEPLEGGALADPAVAGAAAQYASLLAGLARAGADEKVRAALPAAAEDRWRQFAADVRAELFPLMSGGGRRRAERELTAVSDLPHITCAVVHGDLGAENVLWEHTGGTPRISGVVDWDEAAIGDPAEDLAAIGAGYGEDFLRRVLARGDRLWPAGELAARISAIRGTFALQQALSGHRDGDEEERADGLADYR